ncbi:putative mitochondrial hypothetical protein [Leptomonas pyrrhocoris]|uniref:Uncharacterized protein n=1 Tax=Leptomonas pyrrhocoris TaxID=157538 RepID=A0A0N1J4Y5_LEPPY|nr:putative mitochondrial hypothetical protein [Leptomonas pyrrhocoris]KPA81701.1 putative mitochondrial hypothetical protein [Leptomonas pyrrhocoris]|eukprot:XP_015660140.1 putative mitochondrial hypothetical protein [Leptomonas pyrrhocoris]
MAFLPSLRRLAASWKLPFILVAAPTLREMSALFPATGDAEPAPNLITRQMRNPVPPISHRRDDGSRVTQSKQKELKKQGFNAIIRWCAYHQEAQAKSCGSSVGSSSADEEETKRMDAAVMRWVNDSLDSFSCGQSLVVLTFLCDVLQRRNQKERNMLSPSSSSTLDGLTDQLTHTIGLLVTHAVTNEQLTLQPFFILLSAVYGLTRITDGIPLHLRNAVLDVLEPPPALWLALLHQLRIFSTIAGEGEGLDASVHIEALLTVLLLFDPLRCSTLFAPNDYKMMDGLLRSLVRLLQPALRVSRAIRQRKDAELDERREMQRTTAEELFVNVERDEHDTRPEDAEEEDKADTAVSVSHIDDDVNRLQMRSRISMRDCCRILTHTRNAAPSCRRDIMEFFLCVVHDPAALTRVEVQQLPTFFDAPHMYKDVKDTKLAEYVAHAGGISELELLVPLLPFMSDPARFAVVLEEQLNIEMMRSTKLDAHLATLILHTTGQRLAWAFRAFLVQCSLANTPELLHAVVAALEHNGTQRDKDNGAQLEVSAALEANVTREHAKVPLTPDLCILCRFLFGYELKTIPFPLPRDLEEAQYKAYSEALTIAGAIVRNIDWPKCATHQFLRGDRYPSRGVHLSPSFVAYSVLTAYLQSLDTYHFLTTEDEMADRDLLNTLVLPLLRPTDIGFRARTLRLLSKVIPHLKSADYQRQLVKRALHYGGTNSYHDLYLFVQFFVTAATELKVFPAALTDLIFRQHTLAPRTVSRRMAAHINSSKAYTTVLVRVVRYVLAAGVLTAVNGGAEAAARRDRVTVWFAHYFNTVLAESRRSDFLLERTAKLDEVRGGGHEEEEREGEGEIDDVHVEHNAVTHECAEGEKAAQGDGSREKDTVTPRSTKNREGDGEEDAENDAGEGEEEDDAADGTWSIAAHSLDEAFTSPVTEDDFETVLTLMLQTGCKASTRALALIAQRLRDKALVADTFRADAVLPEISDAPARDNEARLSWLDESNVDVGEHEWQSRASQLPLQSLPLPAHFVFAVRADSALAIPITAHYLTTLLRTCDLFVFHHVLSSFFVALKRRRFHVVLVHDMQIAEVAMAILQKRLAAYQSERGTTTTTQRDGTDAAADVTSIVAFKSLVQLLLHFVLLPPRTPHLRALVETLIDPPRNANEDVSMITPAAENVTERNSETSDDGGEGEDEDEVEDDSTLQLLRATQATAALSVLQVCAFITSSKLKEFTLAHLHQLALFFPDAADFVFLQVRPQLREFTQRELLQTATQYPPGATDVLAHLQKVDMHASIDLNEFVPLSKKLPMRINEAVLLAHAPFLTVAWVTRVLSALAARHEEMPVSLLQPLLARVEAVADTATESDKSLLLLILQGYLLFGSSSSSTPTEQHDGPTWMDNVLLSATSTGNHAAPLMPEEQSHRIDLVRRCCDQLLSLERISTLDELRYFLVSYPPSLHQLRERGVVTTVEQTLLPSMLTASPVRWTELDTLVRLLSEHQVLLPHTVHMIAEVLFAPSQLELLQRASLTSVACDGVTVLTGCLRIAIRCAEAVHGTHTTHYPSGAFPLLPTVDAVLRVFDVVQDWLAALTTLLSPQSKGSGYTPVGSSLNVFPSPALNSSTSFSFSAAQLAVTRRLCAFLLGETDDLNPNEFARLVQGVGRLKAWDLAMPQAHEGAVHLDTHEAASAPMEVAVDFPRVFGVMFERADPHSRCVLLRALASDPPVFHRFEAVVLRVLQHDIALLSAEDLETVLMAALQVRNAVAVEPLLDAVGTRLLPMMDQCRRSTLVRLLQCYSAFHIDDTAVTLAVLGALERQFSVEVKLDAAQVIIVLEAIAQLPASATPERLAVLCFQRLEKVVQALSPLQLYQTGRLILDLEMGYTSSIHKLVTHILESRDGPRGQRDFQRVAEALCDVFDVEVNAQLRASRLRKRRQRERIRDFYAVQRKLAQAA